jgi:pyrimidine-nucleoside phosphorylase
MTNLTPGLDILSRWNLLKDSEKQDVCLSIINYFDNNTNDIDAIAALARALAASGAIWSWPSDFQPLCDVPSTGGPASLTTLICPYILAACGCFVPKVSVRGSIAGALDVLELLKGFRGDLDRASIRRVLRASRIAHTSNTLALAPADGYLFQLRKKIGKKSVPALVIASLLSKKIAVSCPASAVDVRCWKAGNLGTDRLTCKRNASLFVEVAARLGIITSCVVTDINELAIPFLGRTESLLALKMALSNEVAHPWLADHVEVCIEIAAQALLTAKVAVNRLSAVKIARNALTSGNALATFHANVTAQGARIEDITAMAESFASYPRQQLRSIRAGYVAGIALERLTDALAQVNYEAPGQNDRVGLVCLKRIGDQVEVGEPLLEIRAAEDVSAAEIRSITTTVLPAFSFVEKPSRLGRSEIATIVSSPMLEQPNA